MRKFTHWASNFTLIETDNYTKDGENIMNIENKKTGEIQEKNKIELLEQIESYKNEKLLRVPAFILVLKHYYKRSMKKYGVEEIF